MNNKLYGNLIFELSKSGRKGYSLPEYASEHSTAELPQALRRSEEAGLPECDELTVVRHYTNLSHNNFGVDDGFYPLGSCTMKYNPALNEEVGALEEFAALHPQQSTTSCQGALLVYYNLQKSLAELTGLSRFTLNPCAGAHGELTGLMIIRAYHDSRGDDKRMVHECGALMYYDGANLNPMLGVARPGDMGFDVMHINLHKTFSTPHGGGGPGSGPVGVRKGLEDFLPTPRVEYDEQSDTFTIATDDEKSMGSVGNFFGNFGVVLKAYAWICSLGKEHIKEVGPLATLNANYIKQQLKDVYELPIEGVCKHEFVFDGLKDKSTGVTTMDVAKRLLDYGYHAPTIYFPLLFHEAMMIEPTESESKETIDSFIEVMRTIAREAKEQPELVKTAPHTTPIGRVDDVLAAKQPVLTYTKMVNS